MRYTQSPTRHFLAFFALLCALLLFSRPAQAHEEDHIVQPGETLSEIAQQYGTDTETLRQLNGLGNADLVWVGLNLELPADAEDSAATPASTAAGVGSYTAQAGDTLSAVARTYRTSLAHLVALNQISPAQRLYVGQVLVVPSIAPLQTDVADTELDVVLDAELEAAPAEAISVEESPAEVAEADVEADPDANQGVHTVKAGEHLGMIAADYEVSALQISQANNLSNASLIVPGQQLVIPPTSFEQKAAQAPVGASGLHMHDEFPTTTEKWIDVDLSEQRVVAYDGSERVNEFIIASGKAGTPTVTGSFRIWAKTPVQDMYGGSRAAGDYYYLDDVQWVQYFYEDYAFHGTYWHTNFGTPQSRGCINMSNADAKWLFDWAGPDHVENTGWLLSDKDNVGTLVVVHQ